jgi:hypothetical protein
MIKNLKDPKGNRNRDIVACGAVLQPDALPSAAFGRDIL